MSPALFRRYAHGTRTRTTSTPIRPPGTVRVVVVGRHKGCESASDGRPILGRLPMPRHGRCGTACTTVRSGMAIGDVTSDLTTAGDQFARTDR